LKGDTGCTTRSAVAACYDIQGYVMTQQNMMATVIVASLVWSPVELEKCPPLAKSLTDRFPEIVLHIVECCRIPTEHNSWHTRVGILGVCMYW